MSEDPKLTALLDRLAEHCRVGREVAHPAVADGRPFHTDPRLSIADMESLIAAARSGLANDAVRSWASDIRMSADITRDRDAYREAHENALASWDVDRRNLSARIDHLTADRDALRGEVERLKAELAVPPVLRPLTPQQIEDALNEGRAESKAARGDNAFRHMKSQLAACRAALREACDGWLARECEEAERTNHAHLTNMQRIATLRQIADGGE